MDKVAIIGTAQWASAQPTSHAFYELATIVAEQALHNAGIDRGAVDAWFMGEYDLSVGRTASHMYTVPAAGGFYQDEIRIHDDGLFAAVQAFLGILSGEYEVVLVVSTGVASETCQDRLSTYSLDPFFVRPLGLTEAIANAMQAHSYRIRHNITNIEGAQRVVKSRTQAQLNANASVWAPITVSEVLNAPYAVYPLRSPEFAPYCDGACAVVMASEPVARRLGRPPIWIRGIGWANDTYHLGDKDLAHLPALEKAAEMAYHMADITDPPRQVDVAELYDVTVYHEIMASEALGLFEKGAMHQWLQEPLSTPGPAINPSGGLIGGRPAAAAGLIRLAESVGQVMGRAGRHQVDGARTAMAQSMSGWGNQRAAVMIVGR